MTSEKNSSPRFLPLLVILFIGSGCAALIYEIVWFQLLQLVIGSSAVSMGVLLGTFMGGMCAGSLLLPRVISEKRNPLRVYAALEIGIAVMGILILYSMPLVSGVYVASFGHGLLLRGIVCAVCLLAPTMMMGATLPAIARWVRNEPSGVAWLGFFYGGNLGGAVFGCLLAGFYLLRKFDMQTATFVAVAVNILVAGIGFLVARTSDVVRLPGVYSRRAKYKFDVTYAAIALSGMSALGAEVVWTRILSLIFGGTVYTFSIIVAVFLVGLGIGSTAGSFLCKQVKSSRNALGWCQLLLIGGIGWTAYVLSQSLPFKLVDPQILISPWKIFQLDLLRCFWAILPATCLWGASFPLALAAVARDEADMGRLVGGVYAANTLGGIIGALAFSLILIPTIGTQNAQRVMIGLAGLAAVMMFASIWRSGITVIIACVMICSVQKIPGELIAYGRELPTRFQEFVMGNTRIVYAGEGMNSSIAVSVMSNGVVNFHVSGKVEASSEPQDMRLQRMLGDIPGLFHHDPQSVLIVGCGAGVTAGSFVPFPDMKQITICEIEPLIPKKVAEYFSEENYNVLHDPRLHLHIDDARHFVLTTPEKFDIITSDPIHPWVKGSATLYSREYFQMVRDHLNPGGMVTQWVPLYESDFATVKSEIATFFDVFPNGTIWSNDLNGKGYDIVLLGQVDRLKIDIDQLQEKLNDPQFAGVKKSLKDVNFVSALDLLSCYAGRATDLRPWLADAQINNDRNLRLQYLAGMGLNLYQNVPIYDEMVKYRKFPDDLFVGSDRRIQTLREALAP